MVAMQTSQYYDELTHDELKALSAAKKANPEFFEFLMRAVSIMPERRQTYSGENYEESDSFENFHLMQMLVGRVIEGFDIARTFFVYLSLKFARLLVLVRDSRYLFDAEPADFPSDAMYEHERAAAQKALDRLFDTLVDLVNYAALFGGRMLRYGRRSGLID